MIIPRWAYPLWFSTSRDWAAFWPTLFAAFAVTFHKGEDDDEDADDDDEEEEKDDNNDDISLVNPMIVNWG